MLRFRIIPDDAVAAGSVRPGPLGVKVTSVTPLRGGFQRSQRAKVMAFARFGIIPDDAVIDLAQPSERQGTGEKTVTAAIRTVYAGIQIRTASS